MTRPTTLFALLLAGASAGCSTQSASEHETSQIDAEMTATGSGIGSTHVSVTLHDKDHPLTYTQPASR